ncbi:MAG: sodium:solute symporter [Candidatus Aminicenantes bacterium]|nr:MAG: sodium:solute symporter [Candidatus Aminicenantes bacterium]
MFGSELAIPVLDLIIIVSYLLGILVIGILSVRKMKLTSQGYFLAGRSLRWGMVGAALFASNISTIHLVGLAASGYNEGLVWGNFEWMATFTLILLGLVFAPFYFKSRISTLPEFLERRYGPGSRMVLAFMAIVAALFIHIGMSLYAGAAVFKQFFGIDVVTSIFIISVVTAIYTVLGGLKAVVVTETIQTGILVLGAVAVTLFAIFALPDQGIHNLSQFKAAVKPDQLSMLQAENSAGLAWYAVFLGYPILGIWYWCSDQTIVQRVLGAKTQRDAQIGPLFAGLLKIFPVFIMVFPGVIGYVLFKDVIGADSNQTLPVLINQLIPTGLKGLISAGLLAALMSTIAAALNSSATLVAVDIVKRFKPKISDEKQVQIGRISAVVVMILAMAWSTQGGRYSSIFEAINAIAAHLAPPITTVFLWGVFWRRGTKQAALTTLIFGFMLGAISFLVDLPVIGDVKVITDGWGIPFMMQAWWMFCLCSLLFIIVSLMTPEPDPKSIQGLTWDKPIRVLAQGKIKKIGDPRLLAGFLLAIMIVLYYLLR